VHDIKKTTLATLVHLNEIYEESDLQALQMDKITVNTDQWKIDLPLL
jgi:hypothetical protein